MISSVDITGIKYAVNEKTRKYVLDKIGKLDKYAPLHARKSMAADVKLCEVNKDHGNKYEVDVVLQVPGKVITASDTTLNMMAAIDIVEAKLIAQLRKYKTEVQKRKVAEAV
ncbi:ribosome-associated translation inhibitor RaiA [Candidatus Saccharibacteria bacterium TM7i]|nr:ribosome-associated translation inhibitor RaiA [Candidatus Saccharibacteria bacterium TM7i]